VLALLSFSSVNKQLFRATEHEPEALRQICEYLHLAERNMKFEWNVFVSSRTLFIAQRSCEAHA